MNEDAVPFKLDFASTNATQTLFGVQTAYLRTHLGDASKVREWTMHRMLARFGLPHLRTRHVRFFVNGILLGFYTFMEAPDQDYVMARTYNYSYDKDHSALYKVKTMSLQCGNDELYGEDPGFPEKCTSPDGQGGYDCCADDSWGEPKTCASGYYVKELSTFCIYTCMNESESDEEEMGPYAYERGDHRDGVAVHKEESECWGDFFKKIGEEQYSAARAFFDSGYTSANDCGDFLLSHDIVDRDLGKKEWDATMKDFINTHLGFNGQCENNQCSDKRDIRDQVDVDNWLKNFAVYAVVVGQDSPMGNGNNYFLATAGDSTLDSPKWKMVQYDHNNGPEVANSVCDNSCMAKGLDGWSIVRPTCKGLAENPLVGPLLLDSELHARYLLFVREFVETVYADHSFLSEVREHHQAIQIVANDSPDVGTYGPIGGSEQFNWMESRARKVLDQLDLWDNGTFPEFASINSTEACVSMNTEYFPDKCTSPDGNGGHDCCASWDWGEPKTCAFGYKVKELEEYCWYTCVEGSATGMIVGIAVGATVIVVLLTVVGIKCRPCKNVEGKSDSVV